MVVYVSPSFNALPIASSSCSCDSERSWLSEVAYRMGEVDLDLVDSRMGACGLDWLLAVPAILVPRYALAGSGSVCTLLMGALAASMSLSCWLGSEESMPGLKLVAMGLR